MDSHASIPQAPLPQELVQTPNQAQVVTPTIGDCDVPHYDGLRYGIHPPLIEAHAYEIKASLVRLIQSSKFLGNGLENPYDHLDYFERLCSTFRIAGMPQDSIKLILFPFSLGEKAKKWERAIPSDLVSSWDDCKRVFLSRFYPTQRTHQMRSSILSFKQGSHETFHEAWERLRGYTRDCPHHGVTKEAILSSFYWGVAKEHKWTLDVASKGSFLNLTIEQGDLLVENVAQSDESYMESHDTTPNEGSSEDFMWTALQAKLDQIEMLLSVQQRGVCLDHTEHQDDGNFVFKNGNTNQESILLNHWSNHGVQGLQPTYQENHEPCPISSSVDFEVNKERIPLGFTGQLGDPNHEKEIQDVGTTQDNGLDSIQWVPEEKSVLEKIKGDAFALNGKCQSSFFFPSFEIKYLDAHDEGLMVMETDPTKLNECGQDVLDGTCLQGLFGEHIGSAKKKEGGRATRANLGTTRKMERPQTISLDQSPNTVRLTPLRFKDGKIEYKVKGKGKSKPFSSAKSIISPSLLGDPSQLRELLSRVLTITLEGVPPLTPH
uniref:Retrotransposon gag domain-containing protein n=1 Tax=Noccaea caerulescens TaxID=107243 RepID=A0A1J3H0M1_NOCCA